MTTLPEWREVLLVARALVDYSWIQEDMARDEQGGYIHPTSDQAAGWCAVGAIERAVFLLGGLADEAADEVREEATSALAQAVNMIFDIADEELDADICVVEFNDAVDTNHADVVAAFDRALDL